MSKHFPYTPKSSDNSWQIVEDFKNTWGFLPIETEKFDSLSRNELVDLCLCAMSFISRPELLERGVDTIKSIINNK